MACDYNCNTAVDKGLMIYMTPRTPPIQMSSSPDFNGVLKKISKILINFREMEQSIVKVF
jgi:hypothetical protein